MVSIETSLFFCRPEIVKKAALFHLVEIASIDQLLRLDLFGSRIELRHLVKNRLKSFDFNDHPRFQGFDLRVVSGIQNGPIGYLEIFSQYLVGELSIRV